MKKTFTKKDCLAALICAVFALMCMGAVGKKGRSHAKFIVCQSNLQKWGEIFHLFAQDNDNKLPQSVAGGDVTIPFEAFWMGATLPYYDKEEIRFCPMSEPDPDNDPLLYDYDDYGGTFEHWGPIAGDSAMTWWDEFPEGSYGINEWCACPPVGVDSYWGFPTDRAWRYVTVEGADNIPLLLDCVFVDGFVLETDFPPTSEGVFNTWATQAIRLFCIDRHDGGINGVFLDMSARKVGLKELWTLKWHREYDTEGPWTLAGGVLPTDWPEWMQDMEDY